MVHFSVIDYSQLDECVESHWDVPMYADHWQFHQFHSNVIPYGIFTNCDEVRLWLNGQRYYLSPPSSFPNRVITGFLPWQAGTVRAEGYIQGIPACSHELTTSGPTVKLSFDHETLYVPAEAGYETLISVRATDEEGHPCFHESSTVRFLLEAEAEIIAVDNGNFMHNEPYGADFIHMYHGVASVQIRLPGKKERVKVTAFAEGIRPAAMYIYEH